MQPYQNYYKYGRNYLVNNVGYNNNNNDLQGSTLVTQHDNGKFQSNLLNPSRSRQKSLKRAAGNWKTSATKKPNNQIKSQYQHHNYSHENPVNSPKKHPNNKNEYILRPETDPTPYVKRQLNFASLVIITKIKQSLRIEGKLFDSDKNSWHYRFVLQRIKDLINTRILDVMMNKVVYSHNDVVNNYLKEFPIYRDEEVKKILLKEPSQNASFYQRENVDELILPQAGKIHDILKTRINKCLAENFQGMISNITNYYENEKEILQCIDELPDMEDLCDERQKGLNQIKENEHQCKKSVEVLDSNDTQANNNCSIIEDDKKVLNEYYKIIDNLMIPRLENCLKKYKEEFTKILNNDKDFVDAQEKIKIELRDRLKESIYAANSISGDLDDTIKIDDDDDVEIIDDDKVEIVIDDDDIEIVDDKDDVISIDSDNEWINDIEKEVSQNKTCERSEKVHKKYLPFQVKLFGHPNLPSRLSVCKFLKKFNPSSIKSHKTVKNLLVIDFSKKVDYDNILAASGSKVGNTTFTIKRNDDNKEDKTSVLNQNIPKDIVNTKSIKNDTRVKEEDINLRENNEMEIDDVLEINVDEIIDVDDDDVLIINETNEERKRTDEKQIDTKNKRLEKRRKTDEKVCFDGNKKICKTVNAEKTTPKTQQTNSQLVVMLIGRPNLPSKSTTSKFLNKFNPASIKKHKTVNNLLLISFNNKEDYDNILAANESRVGDAIFIIKAKDANSLGDLNNKSDHVINEIVTVNENKSEDLQSAAVVGPPDNDKIKTEVKKDIKVNEEVKKEINDDATFVEKPSIEDNLTDNIKNETLLERPNKEVFDVAFANKMEVDELKKYSDANIRDIMNKKMIETFIKIGQINKETNYKLLNCKELDANTVKIEQTAADVNNDNINEETDKELDIFNNNDAIKKSIEEAFYKKLNLLKDNMLNVLRADKEYNAVKSTILKNVENMHKGNKSKDKNNPDNVISNNTIVDSHSVDSQSNSEENSLKNKPVSVNNDIIILDNYKRSENNENEIPKIIPIKEESLEYTRTVQTKTDEQFVKSNYNISRTEDNNNTKTRNTIQKATESSKEQSRIELNTKERESKSNDKVSQNDENIIAKNTIQEEMETLKQNSETINTSKELTKTNHNILQENKENIPKNTITDIEIEHSGNINLSPAVGPETNGTPHLDDTETVLQRNNIKENIQSIEHSETIKLNTDEKSNASHNVPQASQEVETIECSRNMESKTDVELTEHKENTKYVVRLVSLPSLPSPPLFREFVKKYKPKYIKRHKSYENLLVIGLSDKTHFDNMLAADGTCLGNMKIIIKASID